MSKPTTTAELKQLEAQQAIEKVAKVKREKSQEVDRLSQLAVKTRENTEPASQILAYLKEHPATAALGTSSVAALVSGNPWMAAAMGAAAYMGAGKSLDNASTGTKAMAAASAAAYITGHPIIGTGLAVAAYAGVGKDFFKSTQEAKTQASVDGAPDSASGNKSPSAKEIGANLWDQVSQKMGFGKMPEREGEQTDVKPVERQRGG